MTDQEKIAALAAELTRIRKMPWELAFDPSPYLRNRDWHHPELGRFEGGTVSSVDEITLAALSGVASEVLAIESIVIEAAYGGFGIFKYVEQQIFDVDRRIVDVYDMRNMIGHLECVHSYHEALIVALKQVEVKP